MKAKKRPLLLPILVVLIGVSIGLFRHFIQKKEGIPKVPESSCIFCHTMMSGFVDAHGPDKISCTACHLGDNTSMDKYGAHNTMVNVPGNLSNASETCAKCHPGIDLRVKNSIMNTMSGIINVDKYVFGENDDLDSLFNIHHLADSSAADFHLRDKCASCHLGREKLHPNPINEKSRGGGCTACHLTYNKNALKAHDKYLSSEKTDLPNFHPSLSLQVGNNHCFGCHSRSGRLSTNYEGWHETKLKAEDVVGKSHYRVLMDQRVFEKKPSDVHHSYGMSCIDCHDSEDVMGDGQLHAHKEEAVKTHCLDCHGTNYSTIKFDEMSLSNQKIIRGRNLDTSLQYIYSNYSNKALINVYKNDQHLSLITKTDFKILDLSTTSEVCIKDVHSNISCSACHTKWAPQCISCHTSFDEDKEGYDLLDRAWKMGKWIEKGDHYLAEFPSLGVIESEGKKQVHTFTPGMIMDLDKDGTGKADFHRLFAPTSAHTISKEGRACRECHLNPVALGYGRGELKFEKDGQWSFKPQFGKAKDGLPKDAWIPFLKEYVGTKSTRNNARPFNLDEQKKILGVGACLSCHKDDSEVSEMILNDFEAAKNKMKDGCIVY